MVAALKRGGSIHGGLFLAAVLAATLALPPLPWPWYLLAPLLAYAAVVLALAPLRRTAPRLSAGRLGGAPLACAAALTAATSAALVAFHAWARPPVTELAGRLPVAAFGSLVLAGGCFSVVNAALEEVVFRGVLWGALADEWNSIVALAVTAVSFGFVHLHGYPPGSVGAVLAGLYGLALGLLRWWTGGLGLALGCHACADATIFGLLWRSGAFSQTAS
jgi:membrane protease YdiL (CAAX protease family)